MITSFPAASEFNDFLGFSSENPKTHGSKWMVFSPRNEACGFPKVDFFHTKNLNNRRYREWNDLKIGTEEIRPNSEGTLISEEHRQPKNIQHSGAIPRDNGTSQILRLDHISADKFENMFFVDSSFLFLDTVSLNHWEYRKNDSDRKKVEVEVTWLKKNMKQWTES